MCSFYRIAAVLCLLSWTVCGRASETLLIPAADFTEKTGNFVAPENAWDDLGVLHGETGAITWRCALEKSGRYHIQALYASGEKRPCTFELARVSNGEKQTRNDVLGEPTGGFYAANLRWAELGSFDLEPGEYKWTLSTRNYLPHLRGFRITTDASLPEDDLFLAALREKKRLADLKQWENYDATTASTRQKLKDLLPDVSAIVFIKRPTFQSSHYYTDFIDGTVFFGSELCLLSLADGTTKNLTPSLSDGIIGRCNLSFDGKKVIFDFKRKIGEGFRIWEVGLDGTGLRQLTFPPSDEPQRIETYRQTETYQHWAGPNLYMHHTDDMHPSYLPDGGFAFVSSRCEHGILCDGADYLTATVLYRADKDGDNIEKLSDNSVSESCPTVLEDGRILYTRWEYVDNGSVTNKGLWSVNPDGGASAEIYGANIAFPAVFNTARQIPGAPYRFVCIGAPHMPLGVGTILKIDTRKDRRSVDGVEYVTPEVDQQTQTGWTRPDGKPFVRLFEHPTVAARCLQNDYSRDGNGNTTDGPLFMDPFPIDENRFLTSCNPDKPWKAVDGYSLYLADTEGNRDLLFRDRKWSAWNPLPVHATKVPPVPLTTREEDLASRGLAKLIVVDIYAGMENVPRGSIKYLRVNEHVPRPWSARRCWDGDTFDQQHSVVSLNAHLGLKIQHGIVPVERDGSANFTVPADKNIFLQALDENFREVQRERTFVNYRPGEVRSCIGCHERASETPTLKETARPLALQRLPDAPGPQPGETSGFRPISYIDDVQPVLDRHCVSCHNDADSQGGINLEGTLTELFNRSYETLMNEKVFPVVGENHPKAGNNHYMPPYSLGSHASRLVKLLDDGHYDVVMPREDWIRLTTWIDSNGQYHGTYFGRKNLKYKDHPDFRTR